MTPVIAVFDIGKTNKKLLLIDEAYQIIHEQSAVLPEIKDEDGIPCEDIMGLSQWMLKTILEVKRQQDIRLKAINISAYGASLVHLDHHRMPVTPLYNYLKPFPEQLLESFYRQYGGRDTISLETASPALGHLNAGMQLYWIKHARPDYFRRVSVSLHLPQYLASIFHGRHYADLTSIGCHTQLWDFGSGDYHRWVKEEDLVRLMAPIVSSETVTPGKTETSLHVGPGIHDSSAALIPYMEQFREPFMLLSTGTWNIVLDPFNNLPLTAHELRHDCLCYLSYHGKPVKASRLMAGLWHGEQVQRLKEFFHRNDFQHEQMTFDEAMTSPASTTPFEEVPLATFPSIGHAYHAMISDLVSRQVLALRLIQTRERVRLFVDGGFGRSEVFMKLLARAVPEMIVGAAVIPQASGLGAALAIHSHWNPNPKPTTLVQLRQYSA